jgi:hypothetical protein
MCGEWWGISRKRLDFREEVSDLKIFWIGLEHLFAPVIDSGSDI